MQQQTAAPQSQAKITFNREQGIEAIKKLAKGIPNNKALREIIKKCEPTQRQMVYDFLKPHLSFKPLSYILIKP
jgi:hypothetical protein